MTSTPLAFCDIESDGLHHGRHVYEIAIIRRDHDPERADRWTDTKFHAFVHVPGFSLSDPYGIKVGGFFDRHPQGREMTGKPPVPNGVPLLSRKAAALAVHQMLHDAHVVGVNPTFDVTSLAPLLRAEGFPAEPWDYHLEDLVAETVGYLRGLLAVNDRLPEGHRLLPADEAAYTAAVELPWKSDTLAALVNVEPLDPAARHTALGDAQWAERWWQALNGHPTGGQ